MLKVFSILGIALGVLSCAMLVKQGMEFGWSAPFATAFDWYGAAVGVVGSALQPIVEALASSLNALLGWKLTLHAQWPHVLVAYLGAAAGSYRGLATDGHGHLGVWVFAVVAAAGVFAMFSPATRGFILTPLDILDSPEIDTLLSILLGAMIFLIAFALIVRLSMDGSTNAALSVIAVPIGVALLIITNAGLGLIGL